jgi:leucyl aminopeptidase
MKNMQKDVLRMNVNFTKTHANGQGILFVPVYKKKLLSKAAELLNEKHGGAITRVLQNDSFKGDKGNILHLPTIRITLFGVGNLEQNKPLDFIEIGAHLTASTFGRSITEATLLIDEMDTETMSNTEISAKILTGMMLRNYQFIKYKTKLKDADKHPLKDMTVVCQAPENAKAAFHTERNLAENVCYVRDLMNEPANILHPESFAADLKTLSKVGLKVTVLGEREMKKLGMNALLGVGQGSSRESYLVIMEWKGGSKKDAPLAFVGKGVTFDTGGISIKPSAKMEEMKMDMGGAAVVAGLMKTLAQRNAKVNAVGVVALVENMPDGNAQRPGDIVKSYSGQTIEILNTDAEGRLVLADALWYTQEQFKPKFMIDLATLTGAIVVCLGTKFAGLFSNDDGLIDQLRHAGNATGEHVWPLPIDDRYDKDIDTPNADVRNTGMHGAGSITAAKFLQRFVNETPWAHLDIAGVGFNDESHILAGRHPRGFGVMLLDNFVRTNYEK